MFTLYLERSAAKSLNKLPQQVFNRIIPHIRSLIGSPRPAGCRKIVGTYNDYRIKIGDYRVVYEIDEVNRRINIMAVGHRKDVYRK